MPSAVRRLPNGSTGDGDDLPPIELYKIAVDEYRFQAQFNWTRTQYMLVFNTAILAAATAVASRPGHAAVLVFALGVLAAAAGVLIARTQHSYYRAARDRMRALEDAFGVPTDRRINTTSTLGGRSRAVSVTQLVYLLLTAIAIADVVGIVIIAVR